MSRENEVDYSRYVIFDDGRIISKQIKKEMACSGLTKNGYVQNTYRTKNGKPIRLYRHRVIWYYFNGEIPTGLQIDHIDCNRKNNRLDNLRLVTPKENINNPLTRKKMELVWSDKSRNQKISDGNRGRIASEEQKRKQSMKMSGSNHPFFGKHRPKQSEFASTMMQRDSKGRFISKKARN